MARWRRGQRPSYRYAPLLTRIRNKVIIAGDPTVVCWEWHGAMSRKTGKWGTKGPDRPVIQLAGRGSAVVHVLRVILSLTDRVPLWERSHLKACHSCDNTKCVSPYHGYWGTDADNTADRKARRPETFWTKRYRLKMKRKYGELVA